MPRPRKFRKGYRPVTIMLPAEYEKLWELAGKVAEREGISRSELIWKALMEYLNIHGALNPQVTIDDVLSPVDELELSAVKVVVNNLLNTAPKTPQAIQAYGHRWVADVLRVLPRARRLMARSGDKELTSMVEQLSRMVKQMTGR